MRPAFRRGGRRRAAKARAEDHTVVPYLAIRDRFLGSYEDTDEIEWLVAVGRFVQDRWLAEENACGGQFDEAKAWDVWDRCTEKQLRDLRAEAGAALKEYTAQKGIQSIAEWANTTLDPVRGVLKSIRWVAEQSLRAVVGAVALVLVGLALVWAAPDFVRRAHGALDAILREPAQLGAALRPPPAGNLIAEPPHAAV